MSTQIKTLVLSSVIFMTLSSKAQWAIDSNQAAEKKKTISVDLTITPSAGGFRAGVSGLKDADRKFSLWIANAEERKVSITISCENGVLWSSSTRDAWYSQVFDLSSLDDGEYLLRVEGGRDLFEKKIIIATNSFVQRDLKIQ